MACAALLGAAWPAAAPTPTRHRSGKQAPPGGQSLRRWHTSATLNNPTRLEAVVASRIRQNTAYGSQRLG